MSRKMSTTEFKAKCLEVVEEVERTRQTIVVTRRGKAVAQLAPVSAPKRRHTVKSLHAALQGLVTIQGDIISPIDATWNADQ